MTVPVRPSLQAALRARQIDEDLSEVVDTLAGACWRISTTVRRAALDDLAEPAGETNPHGEVQKPLDLLAYRYRTAREVRKTLTTDSLVG